MSNDLQVREMPTEANSAATPETKPQDEVLTAIVRDSRNDPQAFLNETVAEHGGE